MIYSDRGMLYQIRVEGLVRAEWFEGLEVENEGDGETLVRGMMDQSALHGVLNRIRDLGLVLLRVENCSKKRGFSDDQV